MKKNVIIALLLIGNALFTESLFQVKNSIGKAVLDVTSDGLIILNPNGSGTGFDDTLMVITNKEMKSFVGNDANKGTLARSMSVVSTASSGKGTGTKIMEITAKDTKMSQGTTGEHYTNFSPQNTFIGLNAGSSVDGGKFNVFIGNKSGYTTTGPEDPDMNNSGYYNTFIGHQSGMGATGSEGNTYIGSNSGEVNTSGSDNTFVGSHSGAENTGTNNTFIGSYSCGYSSGNGSANAFLGNGSGSYNTSGSNNTFLGNGAGEHNQTGNENVYIGRYTGGANTVGTGNVFLGSRAGSSEQGSNKLLISNAISTAPLIYGEFSAATTSAKVGINTNNTRSKNFYVSGTAGGSSTWAQIQKEDGKSNVTTISSALDKIIGLRGVKYNYQDEETSKETMQIGFLASEVEKVLPEVVEKSGDTYSIQYEPINAVLVEAVKELNQKNQQLENRSKELEIRNTKLENEIFEIKEMLKKIKQ